MPFFILCSALVVFGVTTEWFFTRAFVHEANDLKTKPRDLCFQCGRRRDVFDSFAVTERQINIISEQNYALQDGFSIYYLSSVM